jgi:hypothetical protein
VVKIAVGGGSELECAEANVIRASLSRHMHSSASSQQAGGQRGWRCRVRRRCRKPWGKGIRSRCT